MSATDERVRNLITREAADWFIANRGGLTAKERHTFEAWLKTSPVHVEEYLALSVIARDLREACADPQLSVDALVTRARLAEDTPVRPLWSRVIARIMDVPSYRWQTAAVSMAAIAVLSLGLLALWNFRPFGQTAAPPSSPTALHFQTGHGEQQTQRLADNSVLHLNTDTSVTIRYSPAQRIVALTSGEAAFEVAHAPDRPFRVFAGPAQVVAIGTNFDVRLQHDSTVITVVDGRVAVRPFATSEAGGRNSNPRNPPESVQLGADQQLLVTQGEWPAKPITVDARRSTAWLHRQIMFEREPLERVAAEFNRYTPKPIEITTPALRTLEISGVFATDDSEAFLAFLRSLEGVRVEVTPTRILVSQR